MKLCEINECGGTHYAHGICNKHYQEALRESRKAIKPTTEERFWAKVQKAPGDDCWLWTAHKDPIGRGRFNMGREMFASRASWTLANGEIPEGMCICHRCDNPSCVRPDHLFLGTHQENMRDRDAKGRGNQAKGTAHSRARLTLEQVGDIRYLRRNTSLSLSEIGSLYGVTGEHVSGIARGKVWRGQTLGAAS